MLGSPLKLEKTESNENESPQKVPRSPKNN